MLRRLSRPIRHGLVALAIDAVSLILRRLPITWVPPMGAAFGRAVGLFAWPFSNPLRQRLEHALSNPPKVIEIWSDLGRRLFEALDAERQQTRVTLAEGAAQRYAEAVAKGRGVLLATYHLGHWELMAGALARAGYAVTAIAAQPKPGPLQRRLSALRSQLGVNTLSPGRGARDAVERLKRGETVGLFVDQNTAERGREVVFFGQAAHTPVTYERLLAATRSVPLLVWNTRGEDGRYVIQVEAFTAERPLDWLTRRCETLVTRYPTQWVWLHDRWRPRTELTRVARENAIGSRAWQD